MKKRFISVVLCCLILLSSVQVFASAIVKQPDIQIGVQPQWVNVTTISLSMNYSGGKVSWNGVISCNTTMSKITATYKLQKIETSSSTLVGTWPDSKNSSSFLSSSNSATTPKGTYLLSVSATVTNSAGVSETVTDSLVKTFS